MEYKELYWKLFMKTGSVNFYVLYRQLATDNNKDNAEESRLAEKP